MGRSLSPKIVFMGSPKFAGGILESLVKKGMVPSAVFTQEDKKGERGRKILETDVKKIAKSYSIPVYQPKKLNDDEVIQNLKKLEPDFIVVAAYGKILPETVLKIPGIAPVNVHASILPRWRGASPIHHSILYGDKSTGITIMKMDKGIDTGPLYFVSKELEIDKKDTLLTLTEKLTKLAAEILPEILLKIKDGELKETEQKKEGITYAPRIKKEDGHIDFSREAEFIERMVRAFNPWPRCYFFLQGKRITVYESEIVYDIKNSDYGILLSSKDMVFSCGNKTAIRFCRVQMEGKKIVSGKDFLRGFKVDAGEKVK